MTQAIYTSRLLNFKNLPEPKNADDGEPDYSGNLNNWATLLGDPSPWRPQIVSRDFLLNFYWTK